jgi:hypothetical protein
MSPFISQSNISCQTYPASLHQEAVSTEGPPSFLIVEPDLDSSASILPVASSL